MLLYCSQGHKNPPNSRFCGECGQSLLDPSISQIRTINLTGHKPDPNSSSNPQKGSTQVIATTTPHAGWLRPWAVRFAGVSLAGLIGISAWAVMNSVIHSIHSMPLAQRSPSFSEKTQTDKVFRRLQALAIKPSFLNLLVDEQFYAKYPALRGRSLKNNPEDASLRQEWDDFAQDLLAQLEQAKLSPIARHKLGSYSQQDYEIWKEKANSKQLEKLTDQRFAALFPQQQNQKLNLQTFGQIWYALFWDQVNHA